MKHTWQITAILIALFFIAQVVGLFIVNAYVDHKAVQETGKITFIDLPYKIERPEVEEKTSFIYIFIAIVLGTLLFLLIIKMKKPILWKGWFFLAILITLSVAFSAFVPAIVAGVLALAVAYFRVVKPNILVHNISEVFIYGGLAAIFVPILNIFSVVMLLILISIYDMYAVWKSKHMVKLAKFQAKSQMFAGLQLPYDLKKFNQAAKAQAQPKKASMTAKKSKTVLLRTAILGGGDIGFPLLFAGVVFKGLVLQESVTLGILHSLIISVFATIALFVLLYMAKKDRFYPAMPFITLGCFVGYALLFVLRIV